MNVGDLRERITIQAQTLAPNGSGGTVGAWFDLITTWAKVEPLEGSRTAQAGQLLHNRRFRIKTRHRIDFEVMERLKIVHRGVDIILHSLYNEDYKNRVFIYDGYADAKGPNTAESDAIQLYENGDIQFYENGDIQYYEG